MIFTNVLGRGSSPPLCFSMRSREQFLEVRFAHNVGLRARRGESSSPQLGLHRNAFFVRQRVADFKIPLYHRPHESILFRARSPYQLPPAPPPPKSPPPLGLLPPPLSDALLPPLPLPESLSFDPPPHLKCSII